MIILGGTKFNIKNKDDTITRIKTLERVYGYKTLNHIKLTTNKDITKTKDVNEIIKTLINSIDGHNLLTIMLEKLYMSIVMYLFDKLKDKAEITDVVVDDVNNPFDELITLRQLKFDDNDMDSKIKEVKGYCKYEPLLRLKKLLDIPYEKYNIKLPDLTIITTKLQIEDELDDEDMIETSKDLLKFIKNYKNEIHKYIDNLNNKCVIISDIIKQINNG